MRLPTSESAKAAQRPTTRPFEARCPRCNVTAPIERRRCLHCGGPTSPSTGSSNLTSGNLEALLRAAVTGESGDVAPAPGAPPRDAWTKPPDSTRGFPTLPSRTPDARRAPMRAPTGPIGVATPDESAAEGEPNTATPIVRRLGGLAWIVGLVAYSILRQCHGQ